MWKRKRQRNYILEKRRKEREIGRGLRDTERPIFGKRKRQGDFILKKRRR